MCGGRLGGWSTRPEWTSTRSLSAPAHKLESLERLAALYKDGLLMQAEYDQQGPMSLTQRSELERFRRRMDSDQTLPGVTPASRRRTCLVVDVDAAQAVHDSVTAIPQRCPPRPTPSTGATL